MKLTKAELRLQQYRLSQLQKYLPTLQLKKMLFQLELDQVTQEVRQLKVEYQNQKTRASSYATLFADRQTFELFSVGKIIDVRMHLETLIGIDYPVFDQLVFQEKAYPLFDVPVWLDAAERGVRQLMTLKEKMATAEKRKQIFEQALREASLRVNLFEKIFIPRTETAIRKVKIYLENQLIGAVCQAKVGKSKMVKKND